MITLRLRINSGNLELRYAVYKETHLGISNGRVYVRELDFIGEFIFLIRAVIS